MAIVRTGYSFRRAIGSFDDALDRLMEIHWSVAPLTDVNSTFGYNRWAKKAKARGLRPIFGVELGVVPRLGERRPIADYWTFLAIDDILPIHKLIENATSNWGKEPSISYSTAVSAEGVIKIAGERAQLDQFDPRYDIYISLNPATPKGLFTQARDKGHQFLATSNNNYVRAEDKELYRVGLGNLYSTTQTYPQHILSDDEWYDAVEWFTTEEERVEAVNNRDIIFDQCVAELKKASLIVPERPATLGELCARGAEALGVDLTSPIYSARLQRELDMIKAKQFEDYFYILADMINWAKQRMIVGPARGSSCGSLACYLLGITAIDPIPDDLIFERFIDVNRKDLPDVDIDFSDANRHLVFEYVENKYGRDHVVRLGTVGTFRPRSALRQAAIALRVPRFRIDQVLENIIERSSGDSRALQVTEDTLADTEAGRKLLSDFPEIKIATKLEGQPTNASQHAAGIVITREPLIETVAIDQRTRSIMCDKKDAEDYNLLKIDALGLTQLSIFERTLELIGEKPINGFLESLPLDDPAAFEVLNRGHFSGIFQFNGPSLQSISKSVKIESLNDIAAITALARPGAMATGGAAEWVRRKNGDHKVTYPHPLFKPYMEDTLGIVAYQEQILRIGREIGDLSWDDVTELRKTMSKSLGEEYFNRYGEKWKPAAIAKGIPEHIVNKVWDDMCAYGSWAFNKSHAVAYGRVSYFCCWLKAHHPIEFAAATLDAESDTWRQITLLRELRDEGVDYVPVDKEHSTDKWEPVRDGNRAWLVGPLTNVKGFGPVSVNSILVSRKNGTPMRASFAKKLENARTAIDDLFPIAAAIKRLHPDLTKMNIFSEPTPIKTVQPGVSGDQFIIGIANRIVPRDENEPVKVAKRGYKLEGQSRYLNLFVLDDSDEVYCRIDVKDFETLGMPIIERGRSGRAIYAIKGTVPRGFRMVRVKLIRYLGDIDAETFEIATIKKQIEEVAQAE